MRDRNRSHEQVGNMLHGTGNGYSTPGVPIRRTTVETLAAEFAGQLHRLK
jgi:hypothetical protein